MMSNMISLKYIYIYIYLAGGGGGGGLTVRIYRKKFYLTTLSTHFIYGYTASDTW